MESRNPTLDRLCLRKTFRHSFFFFQQKVGLKQKIMSGWSIGGVYVRVEVEKLGPRMRYNILRTSSDCTLQNFVLSLYKGNWLFL